jgi:predicted AlkP superfamily pyrophosphatase or phosphodiesterase
MTKEKFIKPRYGSHSIAEIVPSIQALFGVPTDREVFPFIKNEIGKYDKVILFIVDGFGFNHFQKYKKRFPFLNKMSSAGSVHPITSVFPSTTAAAVTTVHTGLTPQEHGLPEWSVYFEELDEVIETLPFRPLKTKGQDTMLKRGGKAGMLFNGGTLYQKLKSQGVESFVFMPKDLAYSAYSAAVQKGSKIVPFSSVQGLAKKFAFVLKNHKGPAYFFVYWGEIDSAAHHHGPNSLEHKQAINKFFGTLEKKFFKKIKTKLFNNTLVMLSADHGQINVNPEDTIYLNKYPELIRNFAKSRSGKIIPPTGSPRDIFLHIKPKKIEETIKLLQKLLGNKVEILRTSDAYKKRWFGINKPTKRFNNRVGNLLILSRKNYLIWYEHVPGKLFKHKGMHGGATEKEMTVPLAMARMSDL